MIVWINGAFGAGKSRTARAIVDRFPDCHLVNVEKVGTMVRQVVPAPLAISDFQDDPIWRRGVCLTLRELASRTDDHLIVPMTVVDRRWFDEIMGELHATGLPVAHFALQVKADELARRIRRGIVSWPPTPPGWRQANAQRCCDALASETFAVHVNANRPLGAIAEDIGRLAGLAR